MPFSNAQSCLRDILESIALIDEFLAGVDFLLYQNDAKTRSAVERQMQILSEAAVRLGSEAEALYPGPDWKGLRGMGNILRHQYHRVDDKVVWDTVEHDLPQLKIAAAKGLRPEPQG
ncbi:uncharacterized protein with HEPN domain [Silvibacterium bohemicum]|uniref:Uncharacterized protein with HEPN domain n=1 Tax=Silvibacterium bohemicum TaxID=1577686 RepID=A0A841JTQ7_9BACT|nr:HepT-like ribonuclease domain-containing protein [Silvibacterium bohemicum]MBB6142351.1 uncharacterized protein with HEPN domain [Silvibacterium bohemicum]